MGCKSVCFGAIFLAMLAPTWCARVNHKRSLAPAANSLIESLTTDDDAATYIQNAVQSVQSRVGKLTIALKEKWPDVQESLGDFAEGTRDKAIVLSNDLLLVLNTTFCDPATKEKFQQDLAEFRSRLGQMAALMASAVSENVPKAKEAVNSFGMVTAIKLRSLGKTIRKGVNDSAQAQKLQVLLDDTKSSFDDVRSSAFENLESNEGLVKAKDAISDFSEKISALSAQVAQAATDVWYSEKMQLTLTTIQSRTGQVISYLADKWPALKAMIVSYAVAARDKVTQIMGQLLHEVNMCLPEKREQVVVAFNAIKYRIGELSTKVAEVYSLAQAKVAEKWPVVKEQIGDFTQSLSDTVDAIRSNLAADPRVQDAMSIVHTQVEALREAAAQKAEAWQLAELAEKAKAKVAGVLAMLPRRNGDSDATSDTQE
jgi:hypothetical protein